MGLSQFRAWVEWAGLSQTKIAKRLGCSQSMVSRICGGSMPDLEVAVAIERVSAEPREDGLVWSDGPILASSWVPPHVDAPAAEASTLAVAAEG